MTCELPDIRGTEIFGEADTLCRTLRAPGTGRISDAADVSASPDGRYAVFVGTIVDELDGALPTRICQVNLESRDIRVLTFGQNTDCLPKYSPDGRKIAFLSDRHHAGDFQLYLLDPFTGAAESTSPVAGWVEYLHWSPDGRRVLLGVAGHGADVSGGQGAVTSKQLVESLPSWTPTVETGDEGFRWRRVWIYELATGRACQVGFQEGNIWEAVWCGNQAIAAVVSAGPEEGHWYSSRLFLIDIESGVGRDIYAPEDQLGWPASSPSGKHVAIVESVCSDRWIVAGDLLVKETESGKILRVDTRGVDITYADWRSDQKLLLAGHRGFETVVGLYNAITGVFTEVWASREITTGGRYVAVSGFNELGDCVLVGESFVRAPEIAVIRHGSYQSVKPFDLGYTDQVKAIGAVEAVSWKANDGLEINGWLLRPEGEGPFALVMNVHGGPVWHWRPMWLGRARSLPVLMLVNRGYAVFFPNPRGSSGQGRDFARKVKGDMNGADTYDYLAGLDYLVERGTADPTRIGVTGVSYGGGMTAWLITQDSRFAAAVAVAPHTNQVTEHLISNVSSFMSLFLADHYTNPGGKYFHRSPIMHAQKVKTPTLNVCGALDRSTPPEEAVQFHNALLENHVKSVLVIYPEEGHGVRKFPAAIDYAARVVSWFEEHMAADIR